MSTGGSSGKDSLPNVSWKIKLLMEFGALLFRAAMRPNMTLNRRLLKIFDPKVAAVDSSRNLWFIRVYTSSTAAELPVVLYFHGGSYVFGGDDSSDNDASCRHLSRRLSAVVLSVNYRLAPEHKFPSQLRDALDCLKFIDDRGGRP